jgi:hypothetical protein
LTPGQALRKKVEADPADPEVILTVWGTGYKAADVSLSALDMSGGAQSVLRICARLFAFGRGDAGG